MKRRYGSRKRRGTSVNSKPTTQLRIITQGPDGSMATRTYGGNGRLMKNRAPIDVLFKLNPRFYQKFGHKNEQQFELHDSMHSADIMTGTLKGMTVLKSKLD